MNQGQTNYKLAHINRIPFLGNYSFNGHNVPNPCPHDVMSSQELAHNPTSSQLPTKLNYPQTNVIHWQQPEIPEDLAETLQ
jgi:hypothetical protein